MNKPTNLINQEPARLVLFTLILSDEHSDQELIKNNQYEDNLIQKLSDYDNKSDVYDLFSKNSPHLIIDQRNRFIPFGKKHTFQKLTSQSKCLIEFMHLNWPMMLMLDDACELDSINNFLKDVQKSKYDYMAVYIEDMIDYIKEYYINTTQKRRFSKKDLHSVVCGIMLLYMDICANILCLDQLDNKLSDVKDPLIKRAHEDLRKNTKGLPFNAILPFMTMSRAISTKDEYNDLPDRYIQFKQAINILLNKFSGDLTPIEHILKIGFERFLVFMNENIKIDPAQGYLLDSYKEYASKYYQLLLGIRIITEESLEQEVLNVCTV